MSCDDQYVFLSDFSSSRDDWKIKVRVLRLWDAINIRQRKELISTDMVLIDEKVLFSDFFSLIV